MYYTVIAVYYHSPMIGLQVPPGEPTVDNPGPLFPALDTKITPCFVTTSLSIEHTLLQVKYISFFNVQKRGKHIENCIKHKVALQPQ